MEWISVKDRLPTDYLIEVLACLGNGDVVLCCYNTVSDTWSFDCSCNIHEDECECRQKRMKNKIEIIHEIVITHWMALPSLPKEEKSK